MAVPRLAKVTLNMGVGAAVADRKAMDSAVQDLALIAGQQPVVTKARKSEAGFKSPRGLAIGCKVTLRRERMYEFVERLIGIAILACVISAASTRAPSTAAGTSPWASRNR